MYVSTKHFKDEVKITESCSFLVLKVNFEKKKKFKRLGMELEDPKAIR